MSIGVPTGKPATSRPPEMHVEHGELFGHPNRRVVERDRVADHTDRGVAGAAGQARGDDVRRRHDAVAVLVMFVDADAVEAHLVGELELVHVLVVETVGPLRVEELASRCRPTPIDCSPESHRADPATASG